MVEFEGDDGRKYYKHRKMLVGQERGSTFEHGGKDQVKTGAKEFGAMKDLMASLDWTFDHTEKDIKDSLAYILLGYMFDSAMHNPGPFLIYIRPLFTPI